MVLPPAAEAAPAQLPPPAALPVPKLPEKALDKKLDAKATAAAAASAAATAVADPFIYFVQAGAFIRTEDAEQQRAKLALQGFTAKVLEREQSGRTVYRVRLGPMDSRDEAEGLQRKIEAAGIEANLIRVQR
ncbi:SPOR domain-containing protein [Roseateles sp. GG27B]